MTKWSRFKFTPVLPLGKDGTLVTGSKEHIELSRRAAAEGMVLLKNEGKVLPLREGQRIAVFGKAQYDYVKGGGGSGDVVVSYVRNIYEGLKIKEDEGKLRVYDGLIGYYKDEVEKQYAEGAQIGLTKEVDIPEDKLREAAAFTDTAIVTICRFSGEGWDRKGEKQDGDFYLSEKEEKMIKDVTDNFAKVIFVINAGAQIDCSAFAENEKVSSVLYSWQGGMEGGLAVADILTGAVDPSGKLVDTFAGKFSDYPSSESFSESNDYVKYYEDIYVGYRYFETIPRAAEKVVYPFGFGLSYTTFTISGVAASEKDGRITVGADVRNTGEVAGKEVVQVYCEAPQGKLGKAKRVLTGYKKTRLLAPGETQHVIITFDTYAFASFDDTGKVKKSAYVLEKGTYSFYVGNSVRNTVKTQFEYKLARNITVAQLSKLCAPSKLGKRMKSSGTFEKLAPSENNKFKNKFPACEAKVKTPAVTTDEYYKGLVNDDKWYHMTLEAQDLADVFRGKTDMDDFIADLSDSELIGLVHGHANTGSANTSGIGDLPLYGIPNIMTADGPAGLRVEKRTGVTTTAFPIATLLACTWDPELVYEIGRAGAEEVKENNIGMWLTPAMNIHRNPLCGRNFEYFSEDPLIAGTMAAAKVKGIQSQHISACIKHFCCNNKETNRTECDSIVSERALREIYLKGFEICVKTADPWSLMTSYNIVNGTRASENYDTITGILRGEWGYNGMVTTDWGAHSEEYKELKAGNDLKMPSGREKELAKALKEGKITRAELVVCVKRIFEMMFKLD